MSKERYFAISSESVRKDRVRMIGPEFHHLVRVSRIKVGEIVKLLDGRGGIYEAMVERIRDGEATLLIRSFFKSEETVPIDMALPLIKALRLDLAFEKCAEIGVRRIIPYMSERSVWRGGGQDVAHKRERLTRKVVAACKQSGQPHFPEVDQIRDFASLLEMLSAYSRAYLADRESEETAIDVPDNEGGQVLGIVGPEGGLSIRERESLVAQGVVPLSLGPFRLRSETAAICLLYRLRTDLQSASLPYPRTRD
jgi:16S rRNA (uracil1498-N3)-methyltransferase